MMVGYYKLTKKTLKVRVILNTFTLEHGDIIQVIEEDKQHGNVLIDYQNGYYAWKHVSVLKDFKEIK